MAGSHDQPQGDLEPGAVAPLDTTSRWLCGITGLVATSVGGVAVFVSSNDVGSGVLIAAGALFLVMGTTGIPIASAKLGNNEIKLAQIRRGISQILRSATPDVQQMIAEVVVDADLPPSDPLRSTADTIINQLANYEHSVNQALKRAGFEHVDLRPAEVAREYDAIGSINGVVVGVEVKGGSNPLPASLVTAMVMQAERGLNDLPPGSGAIVIARAHLTDGARRFLERSHLPRIKVVHWASEADDPQLQAALEDLTTDRST